MADYISKITLPSGEDFLIKDQQARTDIKVLKDSVLNVARYCGVVTWSNDNYAIYDGSTNTQGLMREGQSYTPKNGDVVIVGTQGTGAGAPKEFIFRETNSSTGAGVWNEFGSTGSLKALAFKENATASYTPAGKIENASFSGTTATINIPYKTVKTISAPNFTGVEGTITVESETLQGNVDITTVPGGSPNYTPAGTNTPPIFSGTRETVAVQSGSGSPNYTPEGVVTAPDVHVTTTNSDVYVIQKRLVNGQYGPNVGTLPSLTTTVMNENLTIGFNSGTLPVCETQSVANGILESYADAPEFRGSGTRLTVTYEPKGTNTAPTFSGVGVSFKGELDGTTKIVSTGKYTPAGNVGQPSFTTTNATTSVSYRPEGTVSASFKGTAATITAR